MPDHILTGTYCDDIRHEVGGKVSLMGCYGDDLYPNTFPLQLRQLCVHFRLLTDVERRPSHVAFVLKDDRKEHLRIDMDVSYKDTQEPQKYDVVAGGFDIQNLQFDEPAKLIFIAILDDEEEVVGPSLNVKLRKS